jgi:hypothetical protein
MFAYQNTPEISPMAWGRCPATLPPGYEPIPAIAPLISSEFLRKVCEPYFEQMLAALQHALQPQGIDQGDPLRASNRKSKGLCMQSIRVKPLDGMFDEETSEVDEYGAFASVFESGSENRSVENIDEAIRELDCMTVMALNNADDGVEVSSEQERSNMVCRHWKSKGWCRLEANCKFLHPENKRGATLGRKAKSGGSSNGDISRDSGPVRSTILSLADTLCVEGQIPPEILTTSQKGQTSSDKLASRELQPKHVSDLQCCFMQGVALASQPMTCDQ